MQTDLKKKLIMNTLQNFERMLSILLLTSCFLTLLNNEVNGQPELITSCSTKCIPFKKCTSAMQLWLKSKVRPTICFFDQKTELDVYVCCPEEDPKECKLPNKSDLSNEIDFKILNGEEADPADFPFMVALSLDIPFEKFFTCGGTLIHKSYVLTAAHCSFNNGKYTPLKYAIVGGGPINDNKNNIIRIVGLSQHPQYSPKRKYHDIAILRLAEEVSNQPACIPPYNYMLPDQTEVVTAGYGRTSFYGDISKDLLKADMLIYNQSNCTKFYGELIESQLCALANPTLLPKRTIPVRSDTCQGDSGGPLVKKNTLIVVGIVSFGLPCGSDYPGVYTKVSPYYEWIQSKISSR